ncbi:MAG: glutaredoxin domain-containing protein [Candidatus Pacebacteria bacterium]|nr:glutaredoxin domain-containing protein [Candidatus Paceibacterota bacterium]
MKMKLFVSDNCPKCHTVKNIMNVAGIEIINVSLILNSEYIKKYNLVSVPVLLIEDDNTLITNIQEIIKKVRI